MEGLLILLLFPLAWPFIAKRIWHTTINWTEMAVQILVVTLVTSGVWAAGKYGQTQDTEIWNGYVVSKDRDHGHYLRSYSCNCRQSCSGSGSNRSCYETCDTCYEDRYTVTWSANTTVGGITFSHLDRSSRSVYNEPDPASYTRCVVGEPASLPKRYTNYVQAVPQSLFHDASKIAQQYAGQIPAYPRVYDFYRINRVLTVGTKVPNDIVNQINNDLNVALKTLGASKQVNIVVVLTEIDDSSYRYAIENAWLGGEKNDVIVILGLNGTEITWADTFTWALNKGNELFQVKLRDSLNELGHLDPGTLTPAIVEHIKKHYDRPSMKDFKYLEEDINPPTWVIILAIILAIGGSLGLSVVFHRTEMDDVIGDLFTGRKNFRRYR